MPCVQGHPVGLGESADLRVLKRTVSRQALSLPRSAQDRRQSPGAPEAQTWHATPGSAMRVTRAAASGTSGPREKAPARTRLQRPAASAIDGRLRLPDVLLDPRLHRGLDRI